MVDSILIKKDFYHLMVFQWVNINSALVLLMEQDKIFLLFTQGLLFFQINQGKNNNI